MGSFLCDVSLFILIFMVLPINVVFGNDRATLLRQLTKTRISSTQLFVGKKIHSKIQSERQNAQSTREEIVDSIFNQLAEDVWRCDAKTNGEKDVMVRNNAFIFCANLNTDKTAFEFGRLGFDSVAHKSVGESMLARNHLIYTPTHVFSVDLEEFLAIPTLKIENIQSTSSKSGKSAEIVSWSMAPSGDDYPKPSFGEIVWLPENGYLIESCTFCFGIKGETNDPAKFSFATEFRDDDGMLLPTKTIRKEPGIIYYCELVSLGKCDSDLDFYTAESIGLKTPTNPATTRLIWISMGTIFVFLAIVSFRMLRNNQR